MHSNMIRNILQIEFLVILIFLFQKLNLIKSSSIDSCYSANSINMTIKSNTGLILPIDCQCTNTDLVCINLKIFSNTPTDSQLEFPDLFLLFEQDNSSINYIMPKNRFSFYGYPTLKSSAFKGVKLVNDPNSYNSNNPIYIDFRETAIYSNGIFNDFGNLENVKRENWPKLYLSITNAELEPLILSSNSFGNLNVEYMSLKYIGQPNFLNANFINGSKIKKLEIKSSSTFFGFAELSPQTNIQISNIYIEECVNFAFTNKTLPAFTSLTNLTIRASGLKQIPGNIWTKFASLSVLILSGNQFNEFDSSTLRGLEDKLVSLDLNNNQINNIKWLTFKNFTRMKTINLSYNNWTAINVSSRIWPNSNELDTVILKGYTFDETSICNFNKELNLSKTFIEIDSNHPCNCFVYFIYKSGRTNVDTKNANRSFPLCYQALINSDPNQVKYKEDTCKFEEILQSSICARLETTLATTNFMSSTSTTTTQIVKDSTTSIPTSTQLFTTSPCIQSTTTSPGLTTISKSIWIIYK